MVVTAKHWPTPPVASTTSTARTNSTSPSGRSASTPVQRPSFDEQLDREPALAHARSSLRSTAATSARSISAPVASPPACTTPRQRVAALAGQQQLLAVGTGLGVEAGAERRELAHPVGAFGHEHADRFDVAEAGARGERVGEVQLGGVGRGERGGDAALRVARRRDATARPSSARPSTGLAARPRARS